MLREGEGGVEKGGGRSGRGEGWLGIILEIVLSVKCDFVR